MKKSILFISYLFPPTGGAGVQRVAKLSKYFDIQGWDVHVLTALNPSVPVIDKKLLDDIPSSVKIHKAVSLEIPYQIKSKLWRGISDDTSSPSKAKLESKDTFSLKSYIKLLLGKIFIPDYQIGWLPFARRKAKRLIKKYNIEYVFISGPPFSPFLLSRFLKKYNIKLIIDFRDEWTEFYLKSYKYHQKDNKLVAKIEKMEYETIMSAGMITMATESFTKNYQLKYPEHALKFKTLTNGYDPQDFSEQSYKQQNTKFLIVYTGTIFNVTTIRYFLQSLEKLLDENPEFIDTMEFKIAGRITPDEQVFIDQFKYKDIITVLGYITHPESVKLLYQADLLVVIVDDLEGSERIIAAKVFEYITIGVPVLALVPETGEIAKIIKSTETGIVISNRNIDEIQSILKKSIKRQLNIQSNQTEILKYSRKTITKQLITYLKEI